MGLVRKGKQERTILDDLFEVEEEDRNEELRLREERKRREKERARGVSVRLASVLKRVLSDLGLESSSAS